MPLPLTLPTNPEQRKKFLQFIRVLSRLPEERRREILHQKVKEAKRAFEAKHDGQSAQT